MAKDHIHPGDFECLGWYKDKYHLAYKFKYTSFYPTLWLDISIRTKTTDRFPVHASFSLNRDKWSTLAGVNAVEADEQLQKAAKDDQHPAARYLMRQFLRKRKGMLRKFDKGELKNHEKIPV